jgi:hypothetical protein
MTEAHGGNYTIYIMEEHLPLLPPELAADYRRRGHSIGPHIWLKLKPTPEEMAARIHEETGLFERYYGCAPRTTRHHCVVWPGWIDTARALAAAGIRLETNYRAAERYQSGYITGSGLPMRFVDAAGEFVECFQQETLLCDDYALIDKSFLPPLSEQEVIALSRTLIDEARHHYHTAVQIYFHPVYSTGLRVNTGQFIHTAGWMEAVLKHCMETGVPMPSTDAWCEFNEQRRATVLGEQSWDPSTGRLAVHLTSAGGLHGATVTLPAHHVGRHLQQAALGHAELALHAHVVQGSDCVLATGDIPPGAHLLVARYEGSCGRASGALAGRRTFSRRATRGHVGEPQAPLPALAGGTPVTMAVSLTRALASICAS